MIDWQQIFSELKANGLSIRRISIETDISISTLHFVKSGGDTATSKGIKIIGLWSDVTHQPFLDFPEIPQDNSDVFRILNQHE